MAGVPVVQWTAGWRSSWNMGGVEGAHGVNGVVPYSREVAVEQGRLVLGLGVEVEETEQ